MVVIRFGEYRNCLSVLARHSYSSLTGVMYRNVLGGTPSQASSISTCSIHCGFSISPLSTCSITERTYLMRSHGLEHSAVRISGTSSHSGAYSHPVKFAYVSSRQKTP